MSIELWTDLVQGVSLLNRRTFPQIGGQIWHKLYHAVVDKLGTTTSFKSTEQKNLSMDMKTDLV